MFVITIHWRSRTFLNLKRDTKTLIFFQILQCFVKKHTPWKTQAADLSNFVIHWAIHWSNRTFLLSQKSSEILILTKTLIFFMTEAPKHRFFSKFAIFCNIFCWETCNMEKTRSWSVRFHHIPGLAYLDRTAGLGCTVIKFYDISSKKVWRFLAFRFFWRMI